MKLSNLTFIAVALCAATVNWSIAKADEVLKFRVIMHATSIQSQEVGDVDGHALGLAHYSGLASFGDGSVGSANFTATTDYVKGSGTYSVYYNVTLKWVVSVVQIDRPGQTRRHNDHFSRGVS